MPPFIEEKDNFESDINRFESLPTLKKWKRKDWAIQLSSLLSGKTLDIFYGISAKEQTDYNAVKDALMRKFSLTEEGFRKELFNTKAQVDESPTQSMSS